MKSKAFTLIELLVVVAIISLLASVVLSALNSARGRGQDSAVKAAMKQLLIQAQNYLDAGNANFGTLLTTCSGSLFSDSRMASIISNIQANDAPTSATACSTDSSGTKFAVSVSVLNGAGGSFCVDNSQGWFKAGAAQTAGATQGTCQ